MLSTLAQNLRLARRGFVRTPAFTIAAVLSLALGIGATTSIFSVVSALLLRPLPYQDADRLAILWNRSPGIGVAEDWFSTAQYFDIKQNHAGFEDVAIAIGANWNLTGAGEPERLGVLRVSANLLPMLGVRAALGDLFAPADDLPGRTGKALLSHGTWMRRYGGAPSVLGQSLTLNGQPYQIVGVLPSSFDLPREVMPTLGGAEHAEVILPLPLAADAARIRSGEDYNLLGKLKPGVALDAAQAEMDALTVRLRRDYPSIYPSNGGLTFSIVPLQDQVVGNVRRSLIILTASVAFVLLIACANVANLLLSRAVAREGEVALRIAMGASRARLTFQFLTESVVLALTGGSLGLLMTLAMLQGIRTLGTASVPRLGEISVNGTVLGFTLAVSLASAVIFGLAPALRLSRSRGAGHISPGMLASASARTSGVGAVWSRGGNARRLLVAAQLSLCVIVLIAAGLLIRSFQRLLAVPPGFSYANVLTFELTMTGRQYADPQRVIDTYRALWERLEQLPGVAAAGGVSMLPLSDMFAWGPIVLEGRPLPGGESFVNVDQRTVGRDYFNAMQIPLLRGRLFTEHDTRDTPRVVVVDDHMAEVLWPGEDPLGKRLRRGGMDADAKAPWLTVVGVVGRIKQYALDERDSRIAMYHPHAQAPARAMNVVFRGDRPDGLTAAVLDAVHAIDPDLPIYNLKTMARRVDDSLARRRFAMFLLTLFAGIALVLASVGVYGVIASFVDQGRREIGIRLAIGATPQRILSMVVGHGALVAAAGVGVGLAGAIASASAIESLLFGVGARDPGTFAVVTLLLFGVAIAGSYIPARRAAGINPVVSLRSE
jgi:putative ABC transport system permease protein